MFFFYLFIIFFSKAKDTNVALKAQIDELKEELERDRAQHQQQLHELEMVIDAKNSAVQRRKDFDAWRQEIAKGAAADAFHACAGKLQKAYAVERLISSSLARTLFAKVKVAQPTEEAFQRIRGVTGNCRFDEDDHDHSKKLSPGSPQRGGSLSPSKSRVDSPSRSPSHNGNTTSPKSPVRNTVHRIAQQQGGNASPSEVHAIVNRFINREADQRKLRNDVAEAETEVERLRSEFNALREQTSNIVDDEGTRMRALYTVVGEHESQLASLIKQHTEVRERAHASIIQLERTRKWARELHLFFKSSGWDTEDFNLEEEESLIDYIRGPLRDHLLKLAELAEKTKETKAILPSLQDREIDLEIKLLNDPVFREANTRINTAPTPSPSEFLPLPSLGAAEKEFDGSDRSYESEDDDAYLRDRRDENKKKSSLLVLEREQDKKKRRSPSRKNPASPTKSAFASAPSSPSKF